MPAVAEPPAQPAVPNVGSAVPSSSGVIHVTQTGMSTQPSAPAKPPSKPEAVAPAKPEKSAPSARDQMAERLVKRVKPETGVDQTPEKPIGEVPSEKAKEKAEAQPVEGEEPEAVEASEEDVPEGTPADKKKVSPWKLVKEHKEARAKIEAEYAELKKLVPNEAVRKQELAELEDTRKQIKELQDEIRYVNYAKSPEFKEKYQKPYEQAWNKAMSELKEIQIEDSNGNLRPVSATDMLEIVNAPLGKAREMAETVFGSFANDVMAHRKEIKNLFEAQAKALEDARAQGEEREKNLQQQNRTQIEALHKQIGEHWEKAKASALEDANISPYLKPIEGNQEHNHRLAKATELVERAFKENPLDPRLSPEERASIVKRHAAIRNRSIAYGPMLHDIKTKDARIAELEAKLKEYESSTPETAGTQPAKGESAPVDPRTAMEQRLIKKARPI